VWINPKGLSRKSKGEVSVFEGGGASFHPFSRHVRETSRAGSRFLHHRTGDGCSLCLGRRPLEPKEVVRKGKTGVFSKRERGV